MDWIITMLTVQLVWSSKEEKGHFMLFEGKKYLGPLNNLRYPRFCSTSVT